MKNIFSIEKMDFLIAVYMFCIAVTELMGGKVFSLPSIGGLHLGASVAIFLIPVVFTINDIVVEVYGAERARSIVRSGLFVIFFIFLFSILAVALPPAKRFVMHEGAYETIFRISARISAASLIAFTVAEFLDVAVFTKLRKRMGRHGLWLRNNVSNIVATFFDTTLFMFLAFYAFDKGFVDNSMYLIGIILPYWILKCIMSIIETPFVYVGVRWLGDKKHTT